MELPPKQVNAMSVNMYVMGYLYLEILNVDNAPTYCSDKFYYYPICS